MKKILIGAAVFFGFLYVLALIGGSVDSSSAPVAASSSNASATAADVASDPDTETATALAGLPTTLVSEYGMDAKLRDQYDYASCTGLHRYGTESLNTTQWGWVRGYAVFECAYDSATEECFEGRFAAVAGGQWYPQLVFAGRCYTK